jgi:hypothetical protein
VPVARFLRDKANDWRLGSLLGLRPVKLRIPEGVDATTSAYDLVPGAILRARDVNNRRKPKAGFATEPK